MTDKKEKPLVLQPIGTNKPVRPCSNCKNDNWWQRKDGGWVCSICHPKVKDE